MDMSQFRLCAETKTIDILTASHSETVKAVQFLVDNKYIDAYDFQSAYFTHKKGSILEFSSAYTAMPYKTIIIHSIDFNNIDEENNEFSDVTCAVTLLKMLHLYMFDSIESILMNKDDYIVNGDYTILVDKSGLFRWETRFGAQFIYD